MAFPINLEKMLKEHDMYKYIFQLLLLFLYYFGSCMDIVNIIGYSLIIFINIKY